MRGKIFHELRWLRKEKKYVCTYFQNIFGGSTNLSRSVSVHSSQSGWSTSPLLEIMSNNSAVFFNLLPKETFWPASPTKVNPWLLFWAFLWEMFTLCENLVWVNYLNFSMEPNMGLKNMHGIFFLALCFIRIDEFVHFSPFF